MMDANNEGLLRYQVDPRIPDFQRLTILEVDSEWLKGTFAQQGPHFIGCHREALLSGFAIIPA
jgi:hypothetical protein